MLDASPARDATFRYRRELARNRVDLACMPLIMLGNAILIAYFGFLIWTMDIVLVSGKLARIAVRPDLFLLRLGGHLCHRRDLPV